MAAAPRRGPSTVVAATYAAPSNPPNHAHAGTVAVEPGGEGLDQGRGHIRRVHWLAGGGVQGAQGDPTSLAPHQPEGLALLVLEDAADAQLAEGVREVVRAALGDAEAQVGHGAQGGGLARLIGAIDQVQVRARRVGPAEVQLGVGEGPEGPQQESGESHGWPAA
jgi:hypothetical protein